MKPKSKFQKQVFEASKTLPPITEIQVKWAYQNCIEHFGFRTKNGRINCLECGTAWRSEQSLVDTLCGCVCPCCQTELKIKDTLKKVFKDYQYFCIITTCRGFQVIRYFYIGCQAKAGQKASYFHSEVVQRWIAPDGRNAVVARLKSISYYADIWRFHTKLEIRKKHEYHDICTSFIYPRERLIPELKRSGFDGNFYKLNPFDLFHVLLCESKAETLLKARQPELLNHFTLRHFRFINEFWTSIKICIRNGYHVKDAPVWCDYIQLLRFFGKDLHNAKYVCPADLKEEHDRYVRKKRLWQEQQDREKAQRKTIEDEAVYSEMKSRFFDIQFSDGLIRVCVLKSVEEVRQEGDMMRHCVFTNEYHLKTDTLILSASIGDKRLETVEFSLSKLKVLQCRGVCNQTTEYHDRIINLVNKNAPLIKKRLAA